MKMTLVIFFSLSVATMALAGCMRNDARNMPPGKHEHSYNTVDSRGTVNKEHTTTNVYYDKYGRKQATVDKETSRDPKGLFNKTKTESHTNTR